MQQTTNILDQMAAIAEEQAPVQEGQIARAVQLAKQLQDLEVAIESAETVLEDLKTAYRTLQEKTLPDFLTTLGMPAFKLLDGSTIEVETQYFGNISEGRREAAHQWLRSNNAGDIIKNLMVIDLGRDSEDAVAMLKLTARSLGLTPEVKETVNAATLKAFVKERCQQEVEAAQSIESQEGRQLFPRELFGVFEKRIAEIKIPKPKRSRK